MNDPHWDVGPPALTASHDPACDDAGLLRRIGQGDEDDEDAMAAFYREHGRVRSWAVSGNGRAGGEGEARVPQLLLTSPRCHPGRAEIP